MTTETTTETTTDAASAGATATSIAWTADVRMLGDRFFLFDIARWAALTGVATSALLAAVFATTGRLDTFAFLLPYLWLVVLGLFAFSWLIAPLLLGNRYAVENRIDATGAHQAIARGRVTRAARGATLAGALASSPTAAGAGLLAEAGSTASIAWRDVRRVRIHERARVLSLQNSWRTVLRLRCADDDRFREVREFVDRRRALALA